MYSICILGRQPTLGIAELESLLGPEAVKPLGQSAALVKVNPSDIPFARLGGSLKLAQYLTTLPFTDWQMIQAYLAEELPNFIAEIPEGKIRFGLSVYDMQISTKKLQATGLSLKKVIRASGRSVRFVPNASQQLNAAQTIHNQLTGPTGLELVLVADGNQTVIAKAVDVQDIEAYAARDQKRPMRDTKVGMLPPKLAQIIINLAAGDADPEPESTVLDPFCGTGVVLQEAALMGFDVQGTDLDERMVEYSQANLDWLANQPGASATVQSDKYYRLDVGDATEFSWEPAPNFIACETYLGRPFSAQPSPDVLNKVIRDVDTIHKKFLKNVARQTEPGFRMCIAVPAWKTSRGFLHLSTLDSLEELGYTRQSFVHASKEDLIYHRKNQVVARELVVLKRM